MSGSGPSKVETVGLLRHSLGEALLKPHSVQLRLPWPECTGYCNARGLVRCSRVVYRVVSFELGNDAYSSLKESGTGAGLG